MAGFFDRFLLALLVRSALGNVNGKFTPERPLVMSAYARARDVRQSMVDVLKLALGKDQNKVMDVRLERLKAQLKPLFTALPKNAKGRMGHSTVRYALHRHFAHHHGMAVRGLEPAGEAWDSSSPVDIMEERVPSYVQHLFEERLHDGFDLEDMALLAATLEHFVHNEASERLKLAYKLTDNQAGVEGALSSEALETVMDAYMVLVNTDGSRRGLTDGQRRQLLKSPKDVFPTWSKTQVWLRSIQEEILDRELADAQAVTFPVAMKIVETTLERYGKHQDVECREMAKVLNGAEEAGSGRIRLKKFYSLGWQFQEKEEYLEQLGALDRQYQPAKGPWVVIPNYVAATANCLASSSIYAVCCMNPCETILRHLESRVQAPSTSPEDLLRLVATVPSATVEAPRSLPMSLVSRLADIAQTHNGQVPLHGRLFALWLHHAYPRECVYPIVSGTTQPMSPEDWIQKRNDTIAISKEDLQGILAKADVEVTEPTEGDAEELPWDTQEELVYRDQKPSLAYEMKVVGRAVMLFGALYAFAAFMATSVWPLVANMLNESKKHEYHNC